MSFNPMDFETAMDAWCIAPEHVPDFLLEKMARYRLSAREAAHVNCHLRWCTQCLGKFSEMRRKYIKERLLPI